MFLFSTNASRSLRLIRLYFARKWASKSSFANQFKPQSNDSHPGNPNLSENMRRANFLRLIRRQSELFDKIRNKNISDIDILSEIVSINNEALNLTIQNGSTEP